MKANDLLNESADTSTFSEQQLFSSLRLGHLQTRLNQLKMNEPKAHIYDTLSVK